MRKILVHYFASCMIGLPPQTTWYGDTLVVTPWVTIQRDCAPAGGWSFDPFPFCEEAPVSVSPAPPRTFPIRVLSAWNDPPRTTSVVGGVAPLARGFVQRFEVVRRDGVAVAVKK